MGNLRQYLFELLGDEGADKETARLALGIDLAELIGKISEKAGRQDVETALSLKADLTELSGVAFTGNYNDLVISLPNPTRLRDTGIIADSTPIENSTRPVTSSGIKTYVDTKIENAVIQCGMQVFKTSGTFIVPDRVTSVKVRLCGGGGGHGSYNTWGGTGGTTSFGSYMSATGGGGGKIGNLGSAAGSCGSGSIADGHSGFVVAGYGQMSFMSCGNIGFGAGSEYGGGAGYVEGVISNLAMQSISVTVGGGGSNGNNGAWGNSGVCIVEW